MEAVAAAQSLATRRFLLSLPPRSRRRTYSTGVGPGREAATVVVAVVVPVPLVATMAVAGTPPTLLTMKNWWCRLQCRPSRLSPLLAGAQQRLASVEATVAVVPRQIVTVVEVLLHVPSWP